LARAIEGLPVFDRQTGTWQVEWHPTVNQKSLGRRWLAGLAMVDRGGAPTGPVIYSGKLVRD
jgi:hypothetical protein